MISEGWVDRFNNCVLYKYRFDSKNFKLIDEIAGYYVSEFVEEPIELEVIDNCAQALHTQNIAMIVMEISTLKKIREKLLTVSNDFSIIKWNNLFV